jgi:hypothetical protein
MTNPVAPNQNLISPTKISTRGGPSSGFWKAAILDILSVGTGALFGFTYYRYLTTGLSPWFVLVALLAVGSVEVLQVFLAPSISRHGLILLVEAAAFVLFFIRYDDWQIVLIAGALAFIVMFYGYVRSRSEVKNSVEIQFFRSTHHMLGALTTGALLVMLLVYAPQAQGDGIFLPRQSFQTFFAWSTGFLNDIYPSLPFNGTFSQFSESLAQEELSKNPTFNSLSPAEQSQTITAESTQLSAEVASATGITPNPSDQVSTVAYDYIVAMLSGWKNQFQTTFIITWVIALFIVLRTLGIIFVWVAQLVAVIVYEAFLSSGFMHITETQHTKEIVEY